MKGNMNDLVHVIYTNAPAPEYGARQANGRDGYRFVLPKPNWYPQKQVQKFATWIQSLTSTDQNTTGYAFTCFRFNLHPHACVAAVFPNFAPDEIGRHGGNLIHALITPIIEGNSAGIHQILALVKMATNLKLPDKEAGYGTRLDRYLKQPRESEIDIPTLSPEEIRSSIKTMCRDRNELISILNLAHVTINQNGNALLRVPSTAMAAQKLATCILALPPRLRLAFYWGCEVEVNAEQNRRRQANVRINGNPVPAPVSDTRLHTYVEKFIEYLEHLDANGIAWLNDIWHQWDIRSWEELFSRYGEDESNVW
ncbi:hypothetical protein TI03_00350 [Achromatium sp. WMS1]|nr:hypothetical protein TI03_00350 [Achromatium sp. WMS1]